MKDDEIKKDVAQKKHPRFNYLLYGNFFWTTSKFNTTTFTRHHNI